MIKKVFLILKKYFEVERFENCIYCNVRLKGNQRKFCSTKCNQTYWRKVYSGEIDKNSTNVKIKERKLRDLSKKQILKILKGGLCNKCKKKLRL